MSKHNYPGLDYSGPGSTANRDAETGIRYGVISQNSIQSDAMSDIWDGSRDLSYENAVKEAKRSLLMAVDEPGHGDAVSKQLQIRRSIDKVIKDYCRNHWETALEVMEAIPDGIEAMWGEVEQDFNDRYEGGDERSWLWEEDGYELSNCLLSDVFVSKSPYFTYAQFCSPCVPGACNLDNPFEGLAVPSGHASFAEDYGAEAQAIGYVRCYCLGHDFFDGEKAPYEVFSVATGKRVAMKTQFKSVAKWPDGVGINLGNTHNISEDTHGDAASAQAACDMLVKNGFGGDGKVFPVWTQVLEEKVEVEQ